MNQKEAKLFAAQLRTDMPTVDLHGLYPDDALQKLELFLFEYVTAREDVLKIVYGIGTGVLKKRIIECLHKHPLVDTIEEAEGHCIVLLYPL
jgi:dsDNA-specific endonuclease/ATPase MutS2